MVVTISGSKRLYQHFPSVQQEVHLLFMSNEPRAEMETGSAMISFTEEEKTLNTIPGKLL